jgi:hypothetical protein
MEIECMLVFADGPAIECESEINLPGGFLQEGSEQHRQAHELAVELFATYPQSIAVVFRSRQEGSCLVLPRPGNRDAQRFISLLRTKAMRAGKWFGLKRKLDA